MIERLTSSEELTTIEHVEILIYYLQVLQDGRSKPDNSGKGGYIRESVYNLKEIEEVKKKINYILGIDIIPDTLDFENHISTMDYRDKKYKNNNIKFKYTER